MQCRSIAAKSIHLLQCSRHDHATLPTLNNPTRYPSLCLHWRFGALHERGEAATAGKIGNRVLTFWVFLHRFCPKQELPLHLVERCD